MKGCYYLHQSPIHQVEWRTIGNKAITWSPTEYSHTALETSSALKKPAYQRLLVRRTQTKINAQCLPRRKSASFSTYTQFAPFVQLMFISESAGDESINL
jgi:hypothetical protein